LLREAGYEEAVREFKSAIEQRPMDRRSGLGLCILVDGKEG